MRDTNHEHEQLVVSDLVHDAVIADADTPEAVLAGKRLHAMRTRVVAECFRGGLDARGDIARKFAELRAAAGAKLSA